MSFRGMSCAIGLALGLLLAACGGGGSDPVNDLPLANVAPLANAGSTQSVYTGTTVMLDGSGSTDANADPLTYKWAFTSKPAGSNATLSSTTAVKPSFVADVAGSYVLSLVVNDGQADSSNTANVTIDATAPNDVPVANAGTAQTVATAATVTLDGSASSDANGNTLTYQWTLTSVPTGSTAVLSSATAQKPTFVADVAGTYIASLVVNDGKVNSSNSATVTIGVYPATGYTKLDAAGLPLADSVPSWSCVRDNVRKLVWEVKTKDGGLRDWHNSYTNYDSTASAQLDGTNAPTQAQIDASTNSIGYKTAVNAQGLCGASDWRLPTHAELRTLVNTNNTPNINTSYFPDVDVSGYCGSFSCIGWFWSSSPFSGDANRAWIVSFKYGGLDGGGERVDTFDPGFVGLRLVRSAQ